MGLFTKLGVWHQDGHRCDAYFRGGILTVFVKSVDVLCNVYIVAKSFRGQSLICQHTIDVFIIIILLWIDSYVCVEFGGCGTFVSPKTNTKYLCIYFIMVPHLNF